MHRISEERRYIIAAFTAGLTVRSIPNLIAQTPVGYDTLLYATQILDWKAYLSDPNILFKSPLFPLIACIFHIATHIDPLTVLNVLQPILYGLLATSFYYMARRILNWNRGWALLATGIFILQTVTLRISWDLLRNELGLAMLLLTFTTIRNLEKQPLFFITLSVLVVLSHQMAGAILLVILIGLTAYYLHKNDRIMARRLIIFSLPAILLSIGMLYTLAGFPILQGLVSQSVLPRTIEISAKYSEPFPFINYLAGEGFINYSGSYVNLLADFISLYAASYLPLLPLVFLGIKSLREPKIDLWTGLCTVALLTVIVSPKFALISWERSMMMLVVPYTFYATKGIMTIYDKMRPRSRKLLIATTLILYTSIAIPYLASPSNNSISLYTAFWSSTKYSPATMLRQGTPLEDIPSVEQVISWLNMNMAGNSCIISRETFVYLTKIYLKNDSTIINYLVNDVSVGLNYAKALNYSKIYWIWWKNGVGVSWYGQTVPSEFKPIYEAGNLAIYEYAEI